MRRYVDVKKVSEYTSLPVKTLYEWSNQGKFPCIKYGRRILFDLKEVDKVMDSLKRPYNLTGSVSNKILGDLNGN